MKKIMFIIIIFLLLFPLFSLQKKIKIENLKFNIITVNNYLKILPQNEYLITDQKKSFPAIPLQTYFFEIPHDKEINSINLKPMNSEQITLQKKIIPIPPAIPFTFKNDFHEKEIEPDKLIYSKDIFPENFVYKTGSGISGNKKIGYVTFYTAKYLPIENELIIPEWFDLQVDLINSTENNNSPANYATKSAVNNILSTEKMKNEDKGYLLISPAEFLPAYQNLLEWRYLNGMEVFAITTQEIVSNYEGIDLQDKIRNCIIDYYELHQISFVTLGADTYFIPDRKVFAFDCEYGAYIDENDLPCDMYYSCLNGNWNANNNEIYGEDDDETDYFPEVFIGRIPATTFSQAENYVERLICYEKGCLADYNKAGGFSMELWAGSDSEVCQMYIYDRYFPDHYNIEFLYDAENTQANAYDLINANQNIIQHTGHAGTTAISLQEGYIGINNIYNLNNEYGGMFYSIGCWSAAFDYSSIGESLMISENKGMLGYCGNSRYGWGAPSAAGFGFSEFFQKEFFKQMFWNEQTYFGELNALQKIPFIPYFSGTSVYKWVAYELNALGDSSFQLMLDNPEEFQYVYQIINDEILLIITSDNEPVENVIVTYGLEQKSTNTNGETSFILTEENIVHLYKYGFIYQTFDVFNNGLLPFVETTSELAETFGQGDEFSILRDFHNPTFQQFDYYVNYEFNDNELLLSSYEISGSILDFGTVILTPLTIMIKPIADSYQMPDKKKIFLRENIYNSINDTLIARKTYVFAINAPDLKIISCDFHDNNVSPGTILPFDLTIKNISSLDAVDLHINFISNNSFYSFEESSYSENIILEPSDNVVISNSIIISDDTPADFGDDLIFEILTSSQSTEYFFVRTIFLPVGSLGIEEDFETEPNWTNDSEWQIIDTFANQGTFSLSCRPAQIGIYEAVTPGFLYIPNLNINFYYKYKMPMYGVDGVFFILEYEAVQDTLLFLGAGGALSRYPYIEGDWQEYALKLDEILSQIPDIGTTLQLKLLFKYGENIPEYNEYAEMPEIGVFIDDLKIYSEFPENNEVEDFTINDFSFQIFPNPVYINSMMKISLYLPYLTSFKADIYNIRGQKVKTISSSGKVFGNKIFYWNLEDESNRSISSGMYFIKIKTDKKTINRKILVLK